MKTDPKGKSGETLHYILNHNNHYAGLQKIKEGVLLGLDVQTVNNVEFSFIKVAVRYIQYIAYTV